MTALDKVEAALLEALQAVRDAKVAVEPSTKSDRRMMLKPGAHFLGVSVKTARKRAKAGAGVLTNKGWVIDVDAAEAMGRRS